MDQNEPITPVAIENLDITAGDLEDQTRILRELLEEVREGLVCLGGSHEIASSIQTQSARQQYASLTIQPHRLSLLKLLSSVRSVGHTLTDVIDSVAAATLTLAVLRDQTRDAVNSLEAVPTIVEVRGDENVGDVTEARRSIQRELFGDNSDFVPVAPVQPKTSNSLPVEISPPQNPIGHEQEPQSGSAQKIGAAIEELSASLEAGHSDQLKTFLKVLGRLHRYSFGNALLISLQKPEATNVAGFGTWKKLGRHVKKGERGIAIFAPLMKRNRNGDNTNKPADSLGNEDDNETTEPTTRPTGFQTVHVFDVSQTDGEPLPDLPEIRGDPGLLLCRLRSSIEDCGIKLCEEQISGGALGESSGGKITIRPGLSEAEEFRILAHEYGHEILHKGDRRKETTKTIRETEAEAVAFAVCHAAGFEMSTSSSDYIQLYDGSSKTLAESLAHIRHAAHKILEDILPDAVSFPPNNAN